VISSLRNSDFTIKNAAFLQSGALFVRLAGQPLLIDVLRIPHHHTWRHTKLCRDFLMRESAKTPVANRHSAPRTISGAPARIQREPWCVSASIWSMFVWRNPREHRQDSRDAADYGASSGSRLGQRNGATCTASICTIAPSSAPRAAASSRRFTNRRYRRTPGTAGVKPSSIGASSPRCVKKPRWA
jgi:hypothetical protein